MPPPPHSGQELQSAPAVLMVRPVSFGFNRQTAASNAFQRLPAESEASEAQELALAEFDGVAEALQRAGVEVLIVPDTPQPAKPDALFPNNWVSFHFDGTVALYPMLAPNRRCERREDVLDRVVREGGFRIGRTVDLTHRETGGKLRGGVASPPGSYRIAPPCSTSCGRPATTSSTYRGGRCRSSPAIHWNWRRRAARSSRCRRRRGTASNRRNGASSSPMRV